MTSRLPSVRTSLVAVLIFQVLALFVRAYLRMDLQQRGLDSDYARDLSYLVVPPILVIFMLPIIRANLDRLRDALDPKRVNLRLVLTAIAIGVAARLVWWVQLFARVIFGLTRDTGASEIVGPVFSFSCPPPPTMLVALLVFGFLIPIVEELINRGLIQSWLMPRGKWSAIFASAILFAMYHTPTSIPFAFIAGIIFSIQYARTQSLWAPIITHAVYDLLIILDWRCLNGVWY